MITNINVQFVYSVSYQKMLPFSENVFINEGPQLSPTMNDTKQERSIYSQLSKKGCVTLVPSNFI